MEEIYITNQTYDKSNINQIQKGEYDHCKFTNCDLSSANFTGYKFIECTFTGCNLSLAKLGGTALRNVKFKDCKMLGLRYDTCNPFGLEFTFDNCQLNHSSFYKTKIKSTVFKHCMLHESDFTECDLTSAVFDHCDLLLSTFDHTILEKVDLRTSINYSINPETNRIKKAKFSLHGITGLLHQYDIEIDHSL